MENKIRTAVALLAVLAAGSVQAFPQDLGLPTFSVQQYRLKNGLRVVLSEDDSLPLVSVVVAYGAGFVRERDGQTGLAYTMENLMFQGSENVGPLQHLSFIQKVGGECNATTTFDRTLFYETLPSNYLALALWLESDRMKSLSFTTSTFEKTRNDLLEEHRRRLATDPYLQSFAKFDALVFPDPVYGRPLIEGGENIRNLTDEDATAFRSAYYVPNNAVIVIVGDFRAAKAKDLIAHYFETIPAGPDVPLLPAPRFKQDAEVQLTESDALINAPAFHLGYRLYPLEEGDRYTLKILEYLLLRGRTSRLHARIVKRDRTAFYVNGGLEERRGVPVLRVFLVNNNAVMSDRCQKSILSEIDKLKGNLVDQAELTKVKNLFKTDYLTRLASGIDRALILAEAATSDVPPEAVAAELDRYLKVSPQMVYWMMNRLFVPRNLAILRMTAR